MALPTAAKSRRDDGYAWPDEPPAVWADPLPALLRGERDRATATLRARQERLAVYDVWRDGNRLLQFHKLTRYRRP